MKSVENSSSASAFPTRKQIEETLNKTNDQLAASPDSIELRFTRAVLLRELGRTDDAKSAYLELLAKDPAHFGALNNLGTLAMETGFQTAARTAYAEAIKHHPENPMGHVNLANALARNHEIDAAMRHYEIALHLDPNNADAHQGLARLLTDLGNEEAARLHRIAGFNDRPVKILPYRGPGEPIRLLVLASTAGGAVPIWQHLDDQVFMTTIVFVDFFDLTKPLPVHDLVFNAIGDADQCASSLQMAASLLQRTSARVINRPDRVRLTGRLSNAQRFGRIPGIVAANMVLLSRELLLGNQVRQSLAKHGIELPFLLRPPGFHNGDFFHRIDDLADLAAIMRGIPSDELLAIQFLDARGGDGKIRKYRVMIVDSTIYPLHVAVSQHWKIHFVTAEMGDHSEHRSEDTAFLENMPGVLGTKAIKALEKIRDTLGLDYAGIDFSLNSDQDLILFEANATMVVNPPDSDSKWDYRRPAVTRIHDAIRRLLTKSATNQ